MHFDIVPPHFYRPAAPIVLYVSYGGCISIYMFGVSAIQCV
jgi:hypothetical protein